MLILLNIFPVPVLEQGILAVPAHIAGLGEHLHLAESLQGEHMVGHQHPGIHTDLMKNRHFLYIIDI